ncbi:putative phage abortive infection protein [Flavobacterium phycosphaerae]|uniref:putative phage abortive infection protein n=1 Tax=Flavobacterium phycosphaerae TaxID=2697515 RepID=UPI001389EA13|nr:putative phage abortive infection protein [Flavobacterium phycosphaerae]
MNHKKIAWISAGLSALITIILLGRTWYDGITFWNPLPIKYDVTGQIGDFIGGVIGTLISAVGFYYLYLTFTEQKNSFERERLESNFFDLIKLHRENVSELEFDGKKLVENDDSLHIGKSKFTGKSVFKVFFNQIIICKTELQPVFRSPQIYLREYEEKMLNHPYVVKNKIDIYQLARIDICYNIVFYGLSAEGVLILKHMFKDKYRDTIIDYVINYLRLKPAYDEDIFEKWSMIPHHSTRARRRQAIQEIYRWRETRILDGDFPEIAENYHNKFIKYYGGHQFRFGHYFRHLFQTVKFINNQETISYKAKYNYIKTLRAQLSTYEQAILFFNSLSSLGRAWEIDPEIDSSLSKFQTHDFELITKYNLIKNISGEFLYGLSFKDYFPLVEYENDNIKKNRPTYK